MSLSYNSKLYYLPTIWSFRWKFMHSVRFLCSLLLSFFSFFD